MKRTNLVLDEDLLKEATRVLGQKTYSATVNSALKEIVRQKQVEELADFVGKLEWIGNLSEMRDDQPVPRRKRVTKRTSTVRKPDRKRYI